MSRLYDRVLAHGCEPLTAWHIIAVADPDEMRRAAEFYAAEKLGRQPTRHEVDAHMARVYEDAQDMEDTRKKLSSIGFGVSEVDQALTNGS